MNVPLPPVEAVLVQPENPATESSFEFERQTPTYPDKYKVRIGAAYYDKGKEKAAVITAASGFTVWIGGGLLALAVFGMTPYGALLGLTVSSRVVLLTLGVGVILAPAFLASDAAIKYLSFGSIALGIVWILAHRHGAKGLSA